MGNINQLIWSYLPNFHIYCLVEGIPENLNEYIDPKFRNLIVIDDLMSETGSDKKVTSLFTKVAIIEISVIYCFCKIYFTMGKKVKQ